MKEQYIQKSAQQQSLFDVTNEVKRVAGTLNVVSLFSGCGGLDLGFEKAGFNIMWANEYDKEIWDTYRFNHKNTILDTRSIRDIPADEVPEYFHFFYKSYMLC